MKRVLCLALSFGIGAMGQGWPRIDWQAWIGGLQSPTDIQNAGDGSGRLFVLEQVGRIRLISKDGVLAATPVLDIRARVRSGGELGLLGLAFPPGFTSKQYFYVNYTDLRTRTTISRFRIRGKMADPDS